MTHHKRLLPVAPQGHLIVDQVARMLWLFPFGMTAYADIHIGVGVVPPPLYYAPPPAYYSPLPPVYYER